MRKYTGGCEECMDFSGKVTGTNHRHLCVVDVVPARVVDVVPARGGGRACVV